MKDLFTVTSGTALVALVTPTPTILTKALLAQASSKGLTAVASGAALAALVTPAPTALDKAVLVGSPVVADSGAVGANSPLTKSVVTAPTAPWPTKELIRGQSHQENPHSV